MIRKILTGVVFGLSASTAHAALICEVTTFDGNDSPMLIREGHSNEFYSLLRAKELEEAARFVACQVHDGDRLIITDQGFASHTVRMLSGDSKGCVGVIPTEYKDNCQ